MADRPVFTYQTRMEVFAEQAQALNAFADLYGKSKRKLFADIAFSWCLPNMKSA